VTFESRFGSRPKLSEARELVDAVVDRLAHTLNARDALDRSFGKSDKALADFNAARPSIPARHSGSDLPSTGARDKRSGPRLVGPGSAA
jgi:hypothetical protein